MAKRSPRSERTIARFRRAGPVKEETVLRARREEQLKMQLQKKRGRGGTIQPQVGSSASVRRKAG